MPWQSDASAFMQHCGYIKKLPRNLGDPGKEKRGEKDRSKDNSTSPLFFFLILWLRAVCLYVRHAALGIYVD